MYELKKMERYLRVNLLGPCPRLMKKEFTGPRSHRVEKHCIRLYVDAWRLDCSAHYIVCYKYFVRFPNFILQMVYFVNLLSSRLLTKNLKIKIYRTIILPVVLYGCEAWSLTLREERKLRVFENMVLRT